MRKVRLLNAINCFAALTLLLSICGLGQEEKKIPKSYIAFDSKPEQNAEVYLDDKLVGSTPFELTGLEPGPYLVTMKKTGYNAAYDGLTVTEGLRRTVEMTLEPVTGLVFIESKPDGADIVIDEVNWGRTPKLLEELPLGDYTVALSVPGYQQLNIPLYIRDRVPQRLYGELRLDSATLTIKSKPTGAIVTVNGIEQGPAPRTIERVPEGVCTVNVEAEGYHPYESEIKLATGERETVVADLEPIPASLKVVSQPTGARIYIDNQFRGKTPLELNDLKPGTYRVRTGMEAHDPAARNVTLARAEERVEEFRLTPNCGSLHIATQPAGATVLIDGKKVGVTKAKEDQTDRISEVLTVKQVTIGEHAVKVFLRGYYETEKKFTFERDKVLTKHVKLRRRFIPDYEVRTPRKTYTGILKGYEENVLVLETSPGLMTRIPVADILFRRPLKGDAADRERNGEP